MTDQLPHYQVGDKAYLVRDLESEGQPLIGEYLGTHEDAVRYLDANGVIRYAPEDCVRIEPFVVSKVPDDD